MPHRENINIVLGLAKRQSRAKREQKMTETFGRYNIFAALSGAPYNRLYTSARSRALQYTAFHAYQQGRSHCFLSVTKQIYNQ